MRVWTDGLLVQCGGISVGLKELTAEPIDAQHLKVFYTARPDFCAYQSIHFSSVIHKDGRQIGVSLPQTITILNEIFDGVNTGNPEGSSSSRVNQESVTFPSSPRAKPLEVKLSAFQFWEVSYIYVVQNMSQIGSFSVTKKGVENHVFWGELIDVLNISFNVETERVIIVDRTRQSGSLSVSVIGKIPSLDS